MSVAPADHVSVSCTEAAHSSVQIDGDICDDDKEDDDDNDDDDDDDGVNDDVDDLSLIHI